MTRRILKRIFFAVIVLALLYLVGSRVSTTVQVRENDLLDIRDLPARLEKGESGIPYLIPDTRKRIEWAGEEGIKTPIAIVYLHGFSDSNRLQGDSIDRVAAQFGANVFYTRYAGHGYEDNAGIEALGNATLQMWADDTVEAFLIGRLLGDQVVVVGFSTGAPLAAWASTHEREPDALVFVSPNFGPLNGMSELAIGPWGQAMVRLLRGEVEKYETPPVNSAHERFATSEYGSNALVTMMAAVKLGRNADLGKITSPVLAVYSPRDKIISQEHFRKSIAKMGSSISEEFPVASSTGHSDEHILMGGVVSNAEATREVEGAIIDFIRKNVAGTSSPSTLQSTNAAEQAAAGDGDKPAN